MFAILDGLSARRVLLATHAARRILHHFAHLPAEARDRAARELGVMLREEETELAVALVREIEEAEGRPLSTLSPEEMSRHIVALLDVSEERDRAEYRYDPVIAARARATLEEMRKMPIRSPWAA